MRTCVLSMLRVKQSLLHVAFWRELVFSRPPDPIEMRGMVVRPFASLHQPSDGQVYRLCGVRSLFTLLDT